MGLFDKPYLDENLIKETTMDSREGSILALRAAHESMVLLKNEGNLLPLDPGKIKKIAVIGPNADKQLLGNYSSVPSYYVTVLEGINKKLGNKSAVLYREGCKISLNDYYKEDIILQDTSEARKEIEEAYEVAKVADVIVLVIGGNVMTSKEGGDRADLKLVGLQDELVDAMVKTGKPVIALLFNGQPVEITGWADKVPAIFECWYLGQETGNAVADVLFGEVNPSGKLCVSIPRTVGQVPVYYFHKSTRNRDYIFTSGKPLYPFGFGLSYTTFEYSDIRLKKNYINHQDTTSILVDITNTGSRKGTEVVQLYIQDLKGSLTRPVKQLIGFQRVTLKPGETKTVELSIFPEHLAFYNRDMNLIVEPGDFSIMAGGSSSDNDLVKTILTINE